MNHDELLAWATEHYPVQLMMDEDEYTEFLTKEMETDSSPENLNRLALLSSARELIDQELFP